MLSTLTVSLSVSLWPLPTMTQAKAPWREEIVCLPRAASTINVVVGLVGAKNQGCCRAEMGLKVVCLWAFSLRVRGALSVKGESKLREHIPRPCSDLRVVN